MACRLLAESGQNCGVHMISGCSGRFTGFPMRLDPAFLVGQQRALPIRKERRERASWNFSRANDVAEAPTLTNVSFSPGLLET